MDRDPGGVAEAGGDTCQPGDHHDVSGIRHRHFVDRGALQRPAHEAGQRHGRGTLRVVAVRPHVEEEIPGPRLPRGRTDGETIGRVLPVGREHEPEGADEAERIGRRLPHPEDGDPFLTEC